MHFGAHKGTRENTPKSKTLDSESITFKYPQCEIPNDFQNITAVELDELTRVRNLRKTGKLKIVEQAIQSMASFRLAMASQLATRNVVSTSGAWVIQISAISDLRSKSIEDYIRSLKLGHGTGIAVEPKPGTGGTRELDRRLSASDLVRIADDAGIDFPGNVTNREEPLTRAGKLLGRLFRESDGNPILVDGYAVTREDVSVHIPGRGNEPRKSYAIRRLPTA